MIPVDAGSNVVITIPTDFTVDSATLTTLTTLGSQMNTSPTWSYDDATRTLTVESFNTVSISSLGFITIVVGPVINPSETQPTGTFTYQIFDPQNAPVSEVLDGITFTASAGGFAVATLEADNYTINKENVALTFTF